MNGHLELVCALDSTRRSHLRTQSFRAPMHLSKPFLDAGALVVNAVNQTAGLFAGDRIVCRAGVEEGASLVLTAPSSSRVHRTGTGMAESEQFLSVAPGAWLEAWPELFIPHRGARHRQRTRIEVAEGGELLFFESLAPGRVASGEAFAFESLEWETDVLYGSRAVVRERYRLSPHDRSLAALRVRFPQSYYASCVVFSPRLEKRVESLQELAALDHAEIHLGGCPLVAGGWIFKVLAANSPALRFALKHLRTGLYELLERPMPNVRRP